MAGTDGVARQDTMVQINAPSPWMIHLDSHRRGS
jgi:hypothetical protein